jgi:hypothetical protein
MGVISVAKCDYCNEDIDYLPFTCRYCGKSYCKAHRIPENHSCTFEFKNDPYKVKNLQQTKPTKIYTDYPAEVQPRQTTSRKIRIKPQRIRDRTNRTRPQVTSLLGMQTKPYGTYGIMIANAVFFLVGFVLESLGLSNYIYISISDFIGNYNYWTFLTSIFIPTIPTILGFFLLLINLLMLFFIGRMIEGRWGWKMLVKIYVLSGIFTSAGILLVQWISSLINPAFAAIQFYSSWGAYIGMIVFIALLMPQQQVTMFLYFIPIRIKMINLIWLVIGLSGMMGIINIIGIVGGFNAGISFPQNLGNIAGALGGLIINRLLRRDF